MSKSEMEMLDCALIGPGMLFLNQYFDTFFDEHFLLWICFVRMKVFLFFCFNTKECYFFLINGLFLCIFIDTGP